MNRRDPEIDERAMAIQTSAGNQAFLVMNWLLIVVMGLRGVRPEWAEWNGFPVDILAVLVGGNLVWLWYGQRGQSITRRGARAMGTAALVGLAVAATLVFLRR